VLESGAGRLLRKMRELEAKETITVITSSSSIEKSAVLW
jgi:hypothetical protein